MTRVRRGLPSAGGPLRALVVDDHEGSRALLEELLTVRRHTVTSAGSLGEAVAALEQGPFDLVVMNLALPASPGRPPQLEHGYALEAAVRARAPRREERTYLIVRAGDGLRPADVWLAHDQGCDAFVLEPDRERLLAKLDEGEARAVARRAPRSRTPGLPLKAKSWEDCELLLGDATVARTSAGGEAVVTPNQTVVKVLYQLHFSGGWSDLRGLTALRTTRRSLARDARKFLRTVFAVHPGPGGDDPLPWDRTKRGWVSRVALSEREVDRVRGEYEELRRRTDSSPEDYDA